MTTPLLHCCLPLGDVSQPIYGCVVLGSLVASYLLAKLLLKSYQDGLSAGYRLSRQESPQEPLKTETPEPAPSASSEPVNSRLVDLFPLPPQLAPEDFPPQYQEYAKAIQEQDEKRLRELENAKKE